MVGVQRVAEVLKHPVPHKVPDDELNILVLLDAAAGVPRSHGTFITLLSFKPVSIVLEEHPELLEVAPRLGKISIPIRQPIAPVLSWGVPGQRDVDKAFPPYPELPAPTGKCLRILGRAGHRGSLGVNKEPILSRQVGVKLAVGVSAPMGDADDDIIHEGLLGGVDIEIFGFATMRSGGRNPTDYRIDYRRGVLRYEPLFRPDGEEHSRRRDVVW